MQATDLRVSEQETKNMNWQIIKFEAGEYLSNVSFEWMKKNVG